MVVTIPTFTDREINDPLPEFPENIFLTDIYTSVHLSRMQKRIVHLSDTHLGYSDPASPVSDGVELREGDIYEAFRAAIDRIIEIKPDAVIHTGDLFHRPSPANRPLVECLTQIKRLSDEKIPFIVIAGNHSTPRSNVTSPILAALAPIDGVYPFFSGRYETLELDGVAYHALPHCNDDGIFERELVRMKAVPGTLNIAMLHSSAGKKYIMDEFGERVIGTDHASSLDEFDYAAFGHWHGFRKIDGFRRAWYSGSIERLSENECSQKKGFALVTIGGAEPDVSFVEVPSRPWIRIEIDGVADKNTAQIEDEIRTAGADISGDSIVTVVLSGIRPEQGCILTNTRVAEIVNACASLSVRRIFTGGAFSHTVESPAKSSLEDLFDEYAGKELSNEPDRDELISLGRSFFTRYEEERRG
jgi:hypothetical protein